MMPLIRRVVLLGLCAILLTAVWTHLTPLRLGGVAIPTGNPARAVYFAVFVAMAWRVLSASLARQGESATRLTPHAWVCAIPFLLGAVFVATGVLDPSHRVVWHYPGSEFGNVWQLSFDQMLTLWSPRAMIDLEVQHGLYRPLKLWMFWLVMRGDLMTPSLVITLGGLGAIVTWILLRWGASVWTAVTMGVIAVIHPVALWSEAAIDFYYAWAALFFLLTIPLIESNLERPRAWRTVSICLLFAAAVLTSEIWLGGIVTLFLLYGRRSRRDLFPLMGVFLVLLALQLFVNARYPIRMKMLDTGWRLVVRNIVFDPYWAFFVPFTPVTEDSVVRLLRFAAGSLFIVFPATVLFRMDAVNRRAAVLWSTATVILGPGLAFFDMADVWTTGRLTFGPNAFLAIAMGLILERLSASAPRRARLMLIAYVATLSLLTALHVLSRIQLTPNPPTMWSAASTGF